MIPSFFASPGRQRVEDRSPWRRRTVDPEGPGRLLGQEHLAGEDVGAEGGGGGVGAETEGGAEEVGAERPELRAEPLDHGSCLPYDATPILQAGGRAISVVNQDGPIPDYHWPTDTADRVSGPAFRRAIGFGIELLRRLDRNVGDRD